MGNFQHHPKQDEKILKSEEKESRAMREAVFRGIQNDDRLCARLESALQFGDYAGCAQPIMEAYGKELFKGRHGADVIHELLSWAGKKEIRPTLSPKFERVLLARSAHRTNQRTSKRRLVTSARLNPRAFDKTNFYSSIPIHHVQRLQKPFPPTHLYVSENSAIYENNMKFVKERDLPDTRKWRKLIYELGNPGLLAHDLEPSQSAVFRDQDGLVAVVLRHACKHKGVAEFLDTTVKKVVDSRNNVRKEDGGHISQMGLSAGSLSRSSLGWVRNIAREKTNFAKHEIINYEASSSFAVLWGLARTLLPDEIISDFEAFMEKIGPNFRMDANKNMATSDDGRGTYQIKLGPGKRQFEFHNAKLAPPAGVMAENYCRFIHYERQPHKWAVSLTTSRQFDPGVPLADAGGNFYIASYGIRIQAAPNTLIAWRPSDWHGTSLFHINPFGAPAEYHQRGLCFVTGNRLFNSIINSRNIIDTDFSHSEPETDEERQLDDFVTELRRSPRLAPKRHQFQTWLTAYRAWASEKT